MAKKWLATLVRARQVQEDVAKQRLATAQRLAQRAHTRVRYDADRIDSLRAADAEASAPAFVAAAVALQSAAATHSAAVRVAEEAAHAVGGRRNELVEAARARRTAEELREQELTVQRARAAVAAQSRLDEVAARIHRDNTASRR
jgi:flagellar biosynthesis chaperone FliJ